MKAVKHTLFFTLLCSVVMFTGCSTFRTKEPEAFVYVPYRCVYAGQPPKIDGKLDDPAWKKAEPLKLLVVVDNTTPIAGTEAKLIWDNQYIYVGFKAIDRDIWAYHTEHDAATHHEDTVEFFFKPFSDLNSYYNFEVNVLTTVRDGYHVTPHEAGSTYRWAQWNCEGVKCKATVRGTLNNWEDQDEYWQMELAIPFKSLPSLKGKPPAPGDTWTFHVARYNYSVNLAGVLKYGREVSCSARLSKFDFHHYPDWAPLVFVGKPSK